MNQESQAETDASRGSSIRTLWPRVLLVTGIATSAVALLDPDLTWLALVGSVAALCGFLGERAADGNRGWMFLAVLAWGYAAGAIAEPEFRADSGGYYEYLRSMAFDGDLDFTNERITWGLPLPIKTPTGLRDNHYAVGSALFWSPFYAVGHLYVWLSSLVYTHGYAASGFTDPYYRSAAMGTITIGLLGAALLAGTLARRFSSSVAILAVFAAILVSPMLYYLFVVPTMAHGLVFGFACLVVFAFVRVATEPSHLNWAFLGAMIGAVTLTRWQSAVYMLPVGLLVARDMYRRRLRWSYLAAFVMAGLVVFSPQLLAWRILYGTWITVPQGSIFFVSGPIYALDVLIHADHGFFNWTPGMLVATLGLLASFRRWRLLSVSGLLVFVATVCVNGSITDWAGADAYGSRRFDVAIPFMALGLAMVGEFLIRRPLVAPALLVGLLGLWNIGLIELKRNGEIESAAPIEKLGGFQGRQLYHGSERLLGALAGQRGYDLAYKMFVGEYLYRHLLLDGTIDLAKAEPRFLASGWSEPQLNRTPTYRWALFPRACLRLPLAQPFDLRTSVLIKTPPAIPRQNVTVVVNGRFFMNRTVTSDWRELNFTVPGKMLRGGENFLCLQFERHLPGEPGQQVAAAVARVQLP
jgi:hypothetical protein